MGVDTGDNYRDQKWNKMTAQWPKVKQSSNYVIKTVISSKERQKLLVGDNWQPRRPKVKFTLFFIYGANSKEQNCNIYKLKYS